MLPRLKLGLGAFGFAWALSVGSTIAGPAAVARDYSLHMIAHVQSRCTLNRTVAFITPAEAGAHGEHEGGAVRIACNVPYEMEFYRTYRQAVVELGPLASRGDDDADDLFGLSVSLPGIDGRIEGWCSSEDLSDGSAGCAPNRASGEARLGAPIGLARFALLVRKKQTFDFPVEQSSTLTANRPAEMPRRIPAHLSVVLTARY